MSYCTKCGEKLDEKCLFCNACGTKIITSNNDSAVEKIENIPIKSYFFSEYINMWKNYANFSDRTTRKGYWMVVLYKILIVVFFVFTIFAAVDLNFGLNLDVIKGIKYLYFFAAIIPGIALIIRRLRDAGKHWTNIFLLLISGGLASIAKAVAVVDYGVITAILLLLLSIPCLIIFIYFLCKKSVLADGRPIV